jgi:hypothetical protein
MDGVFNWAHGMTNGTPSAVSLYDLWNGTESVELDGLIATVGACQVASSAL